MSSHRLVVVSLMSLTCACLPLADLLPPADDASGGTRTRRDRADDDDAPGEGEGEPGGEGEGEPGGEGEGEPGGSRPVVASLEFDAVLSPEGRVDVVARVTDADGDGTLTGGLIRAEAGARIVSFEGSAGFYQASLFWNLIKPTQDIDSLGENESAFIYLEAVFFDGGGNATVEPFMLELTCGALAMCDDRCRDLDSDGFNCGGCGISCPVGTCTDAFCRMYVEPPLSEVTSTTSCNTFCEAEGWTCEAAFASYFGDQTFCGFEMPGFGCSDVPARTVNGTFDCDLGTRTGTWSLTEVFCNCFY